MKTIFYDLFASPIGRLLLVSDGDALTGLYMSNHQGGPKPEPGWQRDSRTLKPVTKQLAAYFAGELQRFDVVLRPIGTEFQKQAWKELRRIPFGETISYGEQARRIGKPQASRAVGRANGQNPISIIVPCHRVIGANGTLTGFGGGLDRKQWLLEHEAEVLGQVALQ
jgi:methylated-DNA-[protein]-cysteine S-methyltransferase